MEPQQIAIEVPKYVVRTLVAIMENEVAATAALISAAANILDQEGTFAMI